MKDHVEQVKETILRLETAWNHKNAYLWASAFTESCDYIDVFGHFHHEWSHDGNAQLHDRVWKTVYAKSHMQFRVVKIDFPYDHLCILVLGCHLEYEFNSMQKVSNTVITAILTKQGPEWKIRNFQNTSVREV
jgi:uncharacterized protein (TIGR02246 family)